MGLLTVYISFLKPQAHTGWIQGSKYNGGSLKQGVWDAAKNN